MSKKYEMVVGHTPFPDFVFAAQLTEAFLLYPVQFASHDD